jgi:hypothetical protein
MGGHHQRGYRPNKKRQKRELTYKTSAIASPFYRKYLIIADEDRSIS